MSDDHLQEMSDTLTRDAVIGALLFVGGIFVGLGAGVVMFMLGRWTA